MQDEYNQQSSAWRPEFAQAMQDAGFERIKDLIQAMNDVITDSEMRKFFSLEDDKEIITDNISGYIYSNQRQENPEFRYDDHGFASPYAELIAYTLNKNPDELFPNTFDRLKPSGLVEDMEGIDEGVEHRWLEITGQYEKDPRHHVEQFELVRDFDRVLLTLTPRQERVLRLRYGMSENSQTDGSAIPAKNKGPSGDTLENVGRSFQVCKERIRNIQLDAVRQLKQPSRIELLRAHLDM